MPLLSTGSLYGLSAGGGSSPGAGAHRYWRIFSTAYQSGGNANSIAELEFRETALGANVISGGTASASSERAGSEANKAIDGNGTTAWWSGSSLVGEYWQYDYGSGVTKSLAQAAITHDDNINVDTAIREGWFAYADSLGVDPANDFSGAWGFTGSTGWSLSQQRIFTDPALTTSAAHRYWGVVIFNNGGAGSVAIAKLEFRASVGGADLTGSGTPISALGTPANAFDADATTRWQGGSTSGFIAYDFGSAVGPVLQLSITGRNDSGLTSPNRFGLVCSDDGTTWSFVKMCLSQTWSAGETRTFNV